MDLKRTQFPLTAIIASVRACKQCGTQGVDRCERSSTLHANRDLAADLRVAPTLLHLHVRRVSGASEMTTNFDRTFQSSVSISSRHATCHELMKTLETIRARRRYMQRHATNTIKCTSTSLVASSSEKGETKRARIRVHRFLPTPVPTQRRSANSDLCTVRIFVKVASCGRVGKLNKLINVLIDSRKIAQRLDRFFESASAAPRPIQKIDLGAVQFNFLMNRSRSLINLFKLIFNWVAL